MKKILLSVIAIFAGVVVNAQTSCATALTISSNGTITTPNYTTSTFVNGCLSSSTGIKAIWYKYTPTSNGEMTISSDLAANNGTTYTNDTRISVFKGTCTSLTCVEYNDDVSDTNYKSTVTVPVSSGTTYYIQWDNRWGSTANPNLGLQFTFNFTAVSCVRPGALDFYLPDNYTTTSASLYWNQAIGSPSNYDTDWSTNFSTPAGSGTIVNTATLNAGPPAYATSTITGVPASSNVRYFVRSNCGGSQSGWQGPYYAYLAKVLPYSNDFESASNNYTDGFIGQFSLFNSTANSTPANYADGGVGNVMYTYNSTTATSNLWAYSRAISLSAGEQVTITFKTRLYSSASASPMTIKVTAGTSQSSSAQTTILTTITESNTADFTLQTATYTAPSAGIYYFGFNNNSAAGTSQTFLFLDTLNFTSVLSTNEVLANSFSMTPNPAKNFVTINSTDNNTITAIEVVDINGRTVLNAKPNAIESNIDLSTLSSGVYMVKINSEKGSVTKKLVKE